MDPEALLDGLQEKLRSEWQQHRKQSFNTNTKGAAYENALQGFLLEYFEGLYTIETRTAIIDRKLECFQRFDPGENEIDVVSSFRQAVPGVVFKSGEMAWVPYDGVAFLCEVKSKLTKPALEDDITKFAKVESLPIKSRFDHNSGRTKLTSFDSNETIVRDLSVSHPLKCLVYDKESISGEVFFNKITETTEVWDLILIVDENLIVMSPELPFADTWYDRFEYEDGDLDIDFAEVMPEVVVLPDGLVWFILALGFSIPRPIPFDTTSALLALVQGEWEGGPRGYETMNAFQRLF